MSQFKVKRIFSSRSDSMPELKVKWVKGSKSSLQDMFGGKMVFKLNNRLTRRVKARNGDANPKPDLHLKLKLIC